MAGVKIKRLGRKSLYIPTVPWFVPRTVPLKVQLSSLIVEVSETCPMSHGFAAKGKKAYFSIPEKQDSV
jgi:hypothetical protein